MFTEIHLIPNLSRLDIEKLKERWEPNLQSIVEKLINEGAGENFLQTKAMEKHWRLLKDEYDLRGFELKQFSKKFELADNFKGLDFSYARFVNSTFTNATFCSVTFDFAEFINCKFINCNFVFGRNYASRFKNCQFENSEFVERAYSLNCKYESTIFINTFFNRPYFNDCSFDMLTKIEEERFETSKIVNAKMPDLEKGEFYKGIMNAYRAGGVIDKYIKYNIESNKLETRLNSEGLIKLYRFANEYITGYGLKPQRVLISIFLLFLIFTLVHVFYFTNKDNVISFSAGAFLTYGAFSEYLKEANTFIKIWYVVESFFGLSSIALFITVLANRIFISK